MVATAIYSVTMVLWKETAFPHYYYYYYVAFNAPCVGYKDDESQAISWYLAKWTPWVQPCVRTWRITLLPQQRRNDMILFPANGHFCPVRCLAVLATMANDRKTVTFCSRLTTLTIIMTLSHFPNIDNVSFRPSGRLMFYKKNFVWYTTNVLQPLHGSRVA